MRFDISYAASVLSRHLSRPNSKLIEAAKRVIRYLRKTRDQGIEWSCSKEEAAAGTNNKLLGLWTLATPIVNSRGGHMADTSCFSITVAFLGSQDYSRL